VVKLRWLVQLLLVVASATLQVLLLFLHEVLSVPESSAFPDQSDRDTAPPKKSHYSLSQPLIIGAKDHSLVRKALGREEDNDSAFK